MSLSVPRNILPNILAKISQLHSLSSKSSSSTSSTSSTSNASKPTRTTTTTGWIIQIIGESGSGKTSLLHQLYTHPSLLEYYQQRSKLLWYSVGKITTMNELLIIIETIGGKICQEITHQSNDNDDNIYHPDSIDDWIYFLKDFGNMKNWLIFLDDVYDPLFIDILLSTGACLIVTSNGPLSLSQKTNSPQLQSQSQCQFELEDLSSNEIEQFLEAYRLHLDEFQLTSHFTKLIHDVSTSPLDFAILLSLINNFHNKLQSQQTTKEMRESALDHYLCQLYDKRTEIAGLCHELMINNFSENNKTHSKDLHNVRVLMTNMMPQISSISASASLSPSHLRRTSIYINTQIALLSLPDHVQAKFILLVILPKQQPVTLLFLSHLWQCSIQIVTDTILSLLSVNLIQMHSFDSFLSQEFSDRIIHNTSPHHLSPSAEISLVVVSLHSIHFEYLDSLVHQSTIWITRVQLAIERAVEYLTHPGCFIKTTTSTTTHHPRKELGSSFDELFFPSMKSHPPRLGSYWRRISELHLFCSPTTSKLNIYTSLNEVIHSLDLSMTDLSRVVRYLRSCLSLMNDCDELQDHDISSWYQIFLELMKQDSQSMHSSIALYSVYYSIHLFRLQEYQTAKRYLLNAYEIYRNIYSPEHRSLSSLLSRLSFVSQALGNNKDAIMYLQESLEIKSILYGTKHPLIGRDLNRLACLLSSQKEYSHATLYHIAAIQSYQFSVGDNHLDTIHAYGNLGITLISEGETKKGMNIIQEILFRLFHAGWSLNHPWIQRYTSYLQSINDSQFSSSSSSSSSYSFSEWSSPFSSSNESNNSQQAAPNDDSRLDLLSIEQLTSSEIILPLFISSIDPPALPHSPHSLSQHSSLLFLSSPVTVVDPNPSQTLFFYSSDQIPFPSSQHLEDPVERIDFHLPQQKNLKRIDKKLTDENRLPNAALVLTE